MTCQKTQSLITPFINNELNLKELEEFIDHVNSCSECREELEVYYALLTAMKQLDENENLSEDFSLELSEKLLKAQENIIHVKFTYYRKKGILFFIILALGIFISLRYGYMRDEREVKVDDDDSIYELRIMYREDRFESYDRALEEYLREHLIYEEIEDND